MMSLQIWPLHKHAIPELWHDRCYSGPLRLGWLVMATSMQTVDEDLEQSHDSLCRCDIEWSAMKS